jgi:hypothetical protein
VLAGFESALAARRRYQAGREWLATDDGEDYTQTLAEAYARAARLPHALRGLADMVEIIP